MNYFKHLDEIESIEKIPGFSGKFMHTDYMTIAFWHVKAGAELPHHHHEHEQVTTLSSGEFEMKVGDEVKICKPGDVVIIPSNVFHSGKAITDCEIMDVFQPIREDFK